MKKIDIDDNNNKLERATIIYNYHPAGLGDVTYLQLYLAKVYTDLSEDQLKYADFNNDSTINILDVTQLQMYIAK